MLEIKYLVNLKKIVKSDKKHKLEEALKPMAKLFGFNDLKF